MGVVSKLRVRVQHQLAEQSRLERVTTRASLLARDAKEPLLRRSTTGDEEWIFFNNPRRKRTWTRREEQAQRCVKPGPQPRKVSLSVSWDCRGILFFELLPADRAINSKKYRAQLEKRREAVATILASDSQIERT